MKKKSALLLHLLFLNSFFTISQNSDSKITLKEKAEKAHGNFKRKNVSSPTKIENFHLNEDDAYQGRKAEFLSQIISTELPIDFPVYNKSYGVKGYNRLITAYYKDHPTILKESLRYKLLPR